MKSDDSKSVHSGELIRIKKKKKDENVIKWQRKDWKALLRESPPESKMKVTNIWWASSTYKTLFFSTYWCLSYSPKWKNLWAEQSSHTKKAQMVWLVFLSFLETASLFKNLVRVTVFIKGEKEKPMELCTQHRESWSPEVLHRLYWSPWLRTWPWNYNFCKQWSKALSVKRGLPWWLRW